MTIFFKQTEGLRTGTVVCAIVSLAKGVRGSVWRLDALLAQTFETSLGSTDRAFLQKQKLKPNYT